MENVFEIKKSGVDINNFIVETIDKKEGSELGQAILKAAATNAQAAYEKNQILVQNIPSNSITADKMSEGSVGTSELQNSSIINEKIANGTITPIKLDRTYIHLQGKGTSSPPASLPDGEFYVIYEP